MMVQAILLLFNVNNKALLHYSYFPTDVKIHGVSIAKGAKLLVLYS